MVNEQSDNCLIRIVSFFLLSFFVFFSHLSYSQLITKNNYQYQLVGCDSTIWMCREEPWVLIFEDNFDGNSLNTNDWDMCWRTTRPVF